MARPVSRTDHISSYESFLVRQWWGHISCRHIKRKSIFDLVLSPKGSVIYLRACIRTKLFHTKTHTLINNNKDGWLISYGIGINARIPITLAVAKGVVNQCTRSACIACCLCNKISQVKWLKQMAIFSVVSPDVSILKSPTITMQPPWQRDKRSRAASRYWRKDCTNELRGRYTTPTIGPPLILLNTTLNTCRR